MMSTITKLTNKNICCLYVSLQTPIDQNFSFGKQNVPAELSETENCLHWLLNRCINIKSKPRLASKHELSKIKTSLKFAASAIMSRRFHSFQFFLRSKNLQEICNFTRWKETLKVPTVALTREHSYITHNQEATKYKNNGFSGCYMPAKRW